MVTSSTVNPVYFFFIKSLGPRMGTRFTEGELDDLLDQLDLEELDLINRYVDPDVRNKS